MLSCNKKTVYAKVFDAQTEMNLDDFTNMAPPCQVAIGVSSDDTGTGESDSSISEDGIVIPHPNIRGNEDLIPAVHGWGRSVVKIEIEWMK